MKEFGSDFHYIESYNSGRAHLTDVFRGAALLADGRQCIVALIHQYGWCRLWMPDNFCYDVIETIKKQTGIEVEFYNDSPLHEAEVEKLPFKEGDALLRMNYFGMRDLRSNKGIPVSVIEDHSHDPFGHWALYSDADWCIASLRKSLPIPEGGMLWSPKGYALELSMPKSSENAAIANKRWEAMRMKADYLVGKTTDKEAFRKIFVGTENWFDRAEPSLIDDGSKDYLDRLDINAWFCAKRRNWRILQQVVKTKVVLTEDESCTPFSFVILTENEEKRNRLRGHLIDKSVYPAILWNVPDDVSTETKCFSQRMLSIHCDGRYTEDDTLLLAAIINEALEI